MKTMRPEFVKRQSRAFFVGKSATVTRDQENIGGDVIKAGEVVKIIGKNKSINTDLDIRNSNDITICGINCRELILHK